MLIKKSTDRIVMSIYYCNISQVVTIKKIIDKPDTAYLDCPEIGAYCCC